MNRNVKPRLCSRDSRVETMLAWVRCRKLPTRNRRTHHEAASLKRGASQNSFAPRWKTCTRFQSGPRCSFEPYRTGRNCNPAIVRSAHRQATLDSPSAGKRYDISRARSQPSRISGKVLRISPNHPLRMLSPDLAAKELPGDREVTAYVGNLLVDFVHIDNLYRVRNCRGKRLEDVGEMLLESNPLPEAHSFDREREVRKHIGDYTLFLTGM